MSQRKVLILCQDEKTLTQLQVNEAIRKLSTDGATLKWASFDSFQEGTRSSTFDAVFAVVGDMTADDLGMSEEFYQYYASAPVFFAFTDTANDEVNALLKQWNDKVTIKVATEANADIPAAYAEANTQYLKLLEDDVKPAFKEFDKDESGAISKTELKELSKKLGNELNDGDLETALKDLDINGDGVVDLDEFARWYFSGMKSYGSNKRSMLKFHGHASKILQKTGEQAKLALVGQELKTKTHKFAVSFNDPKENAGTTLDYNILLGSKAHQATLDELSGWLNDTSDAEWRAKIEAKKQKVAKVFFQIKISTSNAEEKVAKLNELRDKALPMVANELGMPKVITPQFKADGDNILIGAELVATEKKLFKAEITKKIEESGLNDLVDMFKEVDQNISFQLALGTDLKSILSEEEKETPLLKHLAKGFRVSSQITLVSNLKKAISEMLKSENEEEQQIAQTMMMAAPAFIFGINGNVGIEFDDFEEIAEHPMAAPAMATFEQLFEGLMEEAPDSFLNKKLDLSECEEPAEVKEQMSMVNEIIEAVCDFEDPAFNNICFKVAYADLPVSTDLDLHSASIGTGIKLALKAGLLKMIAGKAEHIFNKELEEIYHD